MAVRFILGSAGTGKTYYCIDQIAAQLRSGPLGPTVILLVPEQATYQSERAILEHAQVRGFSRLKVMSFDRLRQELIGTQAARRQVWQIARYMLVERALLDLKGKLQVLARSGSNPGLARGMASLICQIYEHGHCAADISGLIRGLSSRPEAHSFIAKLADLECVLRAYERLVQGQFLDPELELASIRQAIRSCHWLRGSLVWVDGFSAFTGSQMMLLQELLQTASMVHIALCLDPGAMDLNGPCVEQLDQGRLFWPTEQTYAALLAGIRACGISMQDPIILQKQMRFAHVPALCHIERYIFRSSAKASGNGRVQIWQAADRGVELEAVARSIQKLVQEDGMRYRQIAIICPDLALYEPHIKSYLWRFQIPCFIDTPRPLSRHPVAGLVISAMEAIVGGFRTVSILRYLKTGLSPISRSQIDRLASYCKAYGIGAEDWLSDRPWSFEDSYGSRFDQTGIEKDRRQAIDPLLQLKAGIQGPSTGRQVAAAILKLLDRLGIDQTIDLWVQRARDMRRPDLAQEHIQAINMTRQIIDELGDVFADQDLEPSAWLAILRMAFGTANLALIPPTLDQVLIGTVDRSRHPEVKVVFILGATQGDFPVSVGSIGLFVDEELQVAQQHGVRLGQCKDESLANWRYLAYVAFTRASEMLVVSYPLADSKGSRLERSPLVDELLALFDDLQPVDASALIRQLGPQDWYDISEMVLLGSLDRQQVLNQLGDVCPPRYLDLLCARQHDDRQDHLDQDALSLAFGNELHTSATRLADFAWCPFMHFAKHILQLQPEKAFELRPLDLGRLYHKVLEELRGPLMDIEHLPDEPEQLRALIDRAVEQVVGTDPFLRNFAARGPYNRYLLRRASSTIQQCLVDIVQICRAGAFRPAFFEASFGTPQDQLGQVVVALPEGRSVYLHGKIDRIDTVTSGQEVLAIVLDYKRSQTSFDWSGLYHGLDLQLPLYLIALSEGSATARLGLVPVGGFYIQIESPIKTQSFPELQKGGVERNRKARGIFNGRFHHLLEEAARGRARFYGFYLGKDTEPYGYYGSQDSLRPEDFDLVVRYARSMVSQLAVQILSGLTEIRPAFLANEVPCKQCEYPAFCRFEPQYGQYRQLERVSKQDFLLRVRHEQDRPSGQLDGPTA